jgi:hypothetical protein
VEKRSSGRMLTAIIGGSAVMALASVGIAISQESGAVEAGGMQLGSTSTETTPSTIPAVAKAAPGIKGPAKFKAHS